MLASPMDLVFALVAPLSIHFLANAPGKTVDNGMNTCVPTINMGDTAGVPGF